jgi:hypothetical protein
MSDAWFDVNGAGGLFGDESSRLLFGIAVRPTLRTAR